MSAKSTTKNIADNRKARHEYFIEDEYEAGIVLQGTEVKSLREGRANLKDGYARVKNGELFLYQVHISPYSHTHYDNHNPLRVRKLLLHKQEINKINGKMSERGYSMVPLRMYFKNGKAKVMLGLVRGKKQHDKRDTIRERDQKREFERERKQRL